MLRLVLTENGIKEIPAKPLKSTEREMVTERVRGRLAEARKVKAPVLCASCKAAVVSPDERVCPQCVRKEKNFEKGELKFPAPLSVVLIAAFAMLIYLFFNWIFNVVL